MLIAQNLRVNHQIRISPVRVINDKNEQVGVIPIDEAMRLAQEAGMDLVEVAPQDRPPVCRVMDYGKWKYQQKKKHKQRPPHETQLKEVRLRPKTDTHDRDFKLNHARDFLGKGHKVQFSMIFRGRERFHQDRGLQILLDVAAQLSDMAKVIRPPRSEGRRMTMVLTPNAPAPAKPAKPAGGAPKPSPAPQAPQEPQAPEEPPTEGEKVEA